MKLKKTPAPVIRDLERDIQLAGMTRKDKDGESVDSFPYDRNVLDPAVNEVPGGITLTPDTSALVWSSRGKGKVPSQHGFLESFIKLPDQAPERIRVFASRYGVLRLMRRRDSPAYEDPVAAAWSALQPGGVRDGMTAIYPEPIELWRQLATRVRGILRAGAEIHRAKPISYRTYLEVGGVRTGALSDDDVTGYLDWSVYQRWPEPRREVTRLVRDGMLRFAVLPEFWWEEGERPEFVLRGYSLMGRIYRDVAMMLAKVDGLALCAGCGAPVVPKRKPRRRGGVQELSWCDRSECRRKAQSYWTRESRARLNEGRPVDGGNDIG